MKIAVLGTGIVGDTIGSKLIELGHQVMMGSRTHHNEKALAFTQKHTRHASNGTFQEAAQFGEIVFNCSKGESTLDVLRLAGKGIHGKIIIDVSNPLDLTQMPPALLPQLSHFNSLGEEIQNAFPDSKVVKTLNTMWCGLMVNPMLVNNGDHTNFICGNDADAKSTVIELLIEFGWKKEAILDLGRIESARGTEAILPLWVRTYGILASGAFNFKLVS